MMAAGSRLLRLASAVLWWIADVFGAATCGVIWLAGRCDGFAYELGKDAGRGRA